MKKLSTKANSTTKQVNIQARIQFKNDPRKVVYRCLSSDGKTVYNTFFFNGKATSCECMSKKPCYHMTGCQASEDARQPKPAPAVPDYTSAPQLPPAGWQETAHLNGARSFSLMR